MFGLDKFSIIMIGNVGGVGVASTFAEALEEHGFDLLYKKGATSLGTGITGSPTMGIYYVENKKVKVDNA